MFSYRIATNSDLEKLWDYDINRHGGEEREQWKRWKTQYLEYNKNGDATTFVVLDDELILFYGKNIKFKSKGSMRFADKMISVC